MQEPDRDTGRGSRRSRQRRWRGGALTFPALLLFAACGGSAPAARLAPGDQPGGAPGPSPAAAAPIAGLQQGVWTWVDVPESTCDDGSPTGIAVSLGSGPDLVVFLNGGGACWDYLTCFVLRTASSGPFGLREFQALEARTLAGSILDRDLDANPFRDASLAFVPYCTGDIHGGDNVAVYVSGDTQRAYHHAGHANLVAFLARLAATWPSPRKLVLSGSSAGGFGSVLNYDTARTFWPDAQAYLIDDSGPPLERGAVSHALLDAWYTSWRLDKVLDPLCGPACRSDISAGLAAVQRKYPQDRVALLSSLQDQIISTYYMTSGAQLEQALGALASDVIAPAPNARFFFVAGSSHTMLGDPAAFVQGVPLLTWIGQQVTGDPAWTSQRP